MSIEKKKPSNEFYSALDEVISHQIKSREAFDKAIEIGRKQGYDDFTISLFIKEYLKEKLPKTTLWRYLKEINPDEKKVPMEHISYNNVLEQKEPEQRKQPSNHEYEDMILDRVEGFDSMEKYILDIARLFRKLGYSQDKVFSETKRMCKAGGYGPAELDHVDVVLHWKYDTYQKLENFPGKQPWKPLVQYIKIAATLDMYGIPREQISAKIKEIVIPMQGMEESYFIDCALQPTEIYADPRVAEVDYLALWVKSILPQSSGGNVDDERYEAEQEEKKIGIGDGRKYKADERYCRHCIMRQTPH
jgi:hypothetical protein